MNIGKLVPKKKSFLRSKFTNKRNLATLFSQKPKSIFSISLQSSDSFEPPVTSALLGSIENKNSEDLEGTKNKMGNQEKTYQLNGKFYSNISHLFSKKRRKKRDIPIITLKYLKEKLVLDANIHIKK